MIAIRGAITVDNNTRDDILESAGILLREVIESNQLEIQQILSVIFTATEDLNQAYPAEAARELGIMDAGLMCQQEMYVVGSLPKCIRVMLLVDSDASQRDAKHIYLRDAVNLRQNKGFIAIAIDGPAGVGKGTLAKRLAEALGFTHVDSGALYRAVAYNCIETSVPLNDVDRIKSSLLDLNICVDYKNNEQRVLLNGFDITSSLRTPEVSEASSVTAAIPAVREKLLKLQRDVAAKNNIVMEGRDIGSRILPNAQVKIYLDANIDERARRRLSERMRMGITTDLNTIRLEIEERDFRDMNREHSPLKRAADAVLVDSTDMSLQQVLEAALGIVYIKTGGTYGIYASQSLKSNCIPHNLSNQSNRG